MASFRDLPLWVRPGPPRAVHSGRAGADLSSDPGVSYCGIGLPIRYLSNQLTMCWSRSTRCQGLPDRESSCDSPGKRIITTGFLRAFRARNIASPPAAGGVRKSESPSISIRGMITFSTKAIGDLASRSPGARNGASLNQVGWNRVRSAEYHQADQSAIDRWATAAANRFVWVIAQL